MSSCRSSFVSILNNDDNPSFAVRSAPRICRHHSSPTYPYPTEHHLQAPQTSDYRYGNASFPDSPSVSPRLMRQPYDRVSESGAQPISPGSSDCSYDYMSSAGSGSYFPSSRHDASSAYQPTNMSMTEKRLSGNSLTDPPSPPTSINGGKEAVSSKGGVLRKNKYPCPFAASHGCTATFTTSGHAARHGKKHTGEKSVHCPICNKAFTRKDNMKQHIRTHRGHSEDMQTGMTEREWASKRSHPVYDHQRSISQSRMERSPYESMGSMGQSGSHRSHPYGMSSRA